MWDNNDVIYGRTSKSQKKLTKFRLQRRTSRSCVSCSDWIWWCNTQEVMAPQHLSVSQHILNANCSAEISLGNSKHTRFSNKKQILNKTVSVRKNLKQMRSCNLYSRVTAVLHILCVCSLSYPAWKTPAQYDIFNYGLSGCTIFFHSISQTDNFLKEITEHKMRVSVFSTTFIWNISNSKTN
jgi:hypothetical protein